MVDSLPYPYFLSGCSTDHYELEAEINTISEHYKKMIALMISSLIAKDFYLGKKALTSHEIATQLDLPYKLVNKILQEFVQIGIFVELKNLNNEIVYQPGVTESKLTVGYVIDQLDRNGVNELPIHETKELIQIRKTMHQFDKYLDNELGNTFVRDLVK
jgi:DNA-binding IscR family transcriptional regulator